MVGEEKLRRRKKAPVTDRLLQLPRELKQKQVEQKVANVENKVRTVGVLGMLTGVSSTARSCGSGCVGDNEGQGISSRGWMKYYPI